MVLRQVETQREDPDQAARQFEAFLPVGDAALLEAGEVGCAFPDVVFAADVGLDFCRDGGEIFGVGVVLGFVAPREGFSIVDCCCTGQNFGIYKG